VRFLSQLAANGDQNRPINGGASNQGNKRTAAPAMTRLGQQTRRVHV
jgi:hypothetical protein